MPGSIGNSEVGTDSPLACCDRRAKALVADSGKELGPEIAACRSRGNLHRNGVKLKCLIYFISLSVVVFCSFAGLSQRHATGFRRKFMDYIIAGIASVGLLAYLIFALLRPEKF
jgi:K+-transporting ATPase KdpF subunit